MRAPTLLTVSANMESLLDALDVCVGALTAPDMDAKDINRMRAAADRYEGKMKLAQVRHENARCTNLLKAQKV